MNELELHNGLRLYRDELREAIDADLARTQRRLRPRPRLVRVGLVALGGVAAAAAALTFFSGGSSVSSADAAVLRHVAACLSPPAGKILHERAEVTFGSAQPHVYELWAQGDRYRVIKAGHEASWNGSAFSVYRADVNRVYDEPGAPRRSADDAAATLRSLVESGDASVVGQTTLNGVAAYELHVSGSPDPFLNGTAYVAQSDYRPLLIVTDRGACGPGCGERIAYQSYEYLPATAANLRLLDVAAAHPGAQVTNGVVGADRTTTTPK
jgi:hypothetical protein